MNFEEADRRYGDLKRQHDGGKLSAEEFEAQLEQIMVQDDSERWWSKHPETGAWYYFDGDNWIEGTPPDNEGAPYPPPPTETGLEPETESELEVEPEPPGKRFPAAAFISGKRLLVAALAPGKRLLVAALIAAALVGTGSTIAVMASEDDDAPVGVPAPKIVSDLPLQGAGRGEAENTVNAITMALEERDYKVGDVPIEYVSQDNATEQAGKWDEYKCAENAQSAAQDKDVVGWIGPFNSGCAKAQIATLNEASLATIATNNTYVGLTKPGGEPDEPEKYYPTGERNYARVVVTDDKQGQAGALWLAQSGVKSVYILDDSEAYGKGLADQFRKYAREQGMDILGQESIDRDAVNYRSLMDSIAQEKPDAIYFGGITESNAPQLIKDKIRAGMSNEDVIFASGDGLYDDKFIEMAGDAAEGAYLTFPGLTPDLLPHEGKRFVERYQERFPDSKVEAFDAYAYEATNVLLDAIERAYENDGEITREGVVRELFATQDYEGVLGTWSFDENGDTTLTQLTGDIVGRDGQLGVERDKLDVATVATT